VSQGLAPGPRGRAALSVFLLAFFGLQVSLAVRTRLHNDDRYGFAMFHESIRYKLQYHWVMENGRTVRFRVPKAWLKSRGKKILGTGTTTSVMGEGTVRMNIQRFVNWAWQEKRAPGAVGLRATLRYQRNDRGAWQTAVLSAGEAPRD
jgi:hypothetical protein